MAHALPVLCSRCLQACSPRGCTRGQVLLLPRHLLGHVVLVVGLLLGPLPHDAAGSAHRSLCAVSWLASYHVLEYPSTLCIDIWIAHSERGHCVCVCVCVLRASRLSAGVFWLVLFGVPLTALSFDFFIDYIKREYFPNLVDLAVLSPSLFPCQHLC